MIGLESVGCMVPRFPAESLGQESTSGTSIVKRTRVDRAFPLVWLIWSTVLAEFNLRRQNHINSSSPGLITLFLCVSRMPMPAVSMK